MMTVFIHELKLGKKMTAIWSVILGVMLILCVIIYPEMTKNMTGLDEMFASMGDVTAAFGMDKLNISTLIGFYGVECSNVMGIGGSFFAALVGIALLSKEEGAHTAEFLLTHPISRASIIAQKLLAGIVQVVVLNVICVLCSILSFVIINEFPPDMGVFLLFHVAQLAMQGVIFSLCFGISAFVRHGGIGIGIGIAALMYFLQIVSSITEAADWLKYVTPFRFAGASDIISNAEIEVPLLLCGAAYSLVAIVLAFLRYTKKDITA